MFISILYDLLLGLLACIYMPKILYDYVVKKKYKNSLRQRLGLNFPQISKGNRPLVWIHAVSVGETKAVSSLVKTIKSQLDNPVIVVSSVTETGHAEAKRSLAQADYHVYLPIDLKFIIKPIIQRTAPDLVILTETDFWYNFLNESIRQGATVALVNGKISERSFLRFKKFPFFSKKLFSFIHQFCIQSKHYHQRFKELGIDHNKMLITGNLKFDDEYPRLSQEDYQAWRNQLYLEPNDRVIVVGSSHDPEEKQLLEQFKKVWQVFPEIRLMIVPRHPERFNDVATLLDKEGISYTRFSQLKAKKSQVILMDAMGLLRKCYQLADLAIVAGSYTSRVGGHNILEPSSYGVPVLYGPHMHSQPELVELTKEYETGEQVNMPELGTRICELLKDAPKRKEMGENGLRMLKDLNGATKKTWNAIQALLTK